MCNSENELINVNMQYFMITILVMLAGKILVWHEYCMYVCRYDDFKTEQERDLHTLRVKGSTFGNWLEVYFMVCRFAPWPICILKIKG